MKNKFLLLAFLLFCSLSAFAQIQVEQGKLILTDGREIEGKISYYYDNPTVVNIYDAADNKQTFAPKNVKEIRLVRGTRFITLDYNSTPTILQALVLSNKISLFKREATDLEFYASKDSTVHKLENNEVTIAGDNGKRFKKFDYKYVGTLTTLMQDRGDMIDNIQKAEFTEKGLASLVTTYNNGDVSYYFAADIKREKNPYWVAYGHFTKHASFLGKETNGPSSGFQVGAQYYFSSVSRSSIRFGIDISKYGFTETEHLQYWTREVDWTYNIKTLSIKYQYDFVQQEKVRVYLLAHIVEIGHIKKTTEDDGHKETSNISFWPRLSPGMGADMKLSDKISAFAELNNILQFNHVPKSFSIGAKYSFRK